MTMDNSGATFFSDSQCDVRKLDFEDEYIDYYL